MTEVLQMQVENLNSDNQSISSSNGNSPAYEDLKVDTPDEDTRERSSSGEPIRERGSTITKKIPLSEYATLQGILAHQVDEGAACLKCGPEVCAGLDLHFWKKVCKNCGCPRGSHKIQKFIEEKKEVPKPILRQTADEDEEDYKEMEISAPPSKTTIKGKSDTHDSVKYNEEYISRLREFYSHKTAALNFPDYKKLSHEQQLMLQHYINQTQGQEVVSPEAVQSHLKLLAKTSSTGSDYHLDASEPEYRRSHSSEYRQSHSSASSDSSDQQFLQALQLLSFNKDQLRDLSPGVIPEYPDSTDDQLNEEEEVESLQDSLLHRQHNRQSPIQQPSQLPRQQDSQSPIQQDSQLPRQQPSQSPRHQDSQLPRKQGSQLAKKQRSPTDVSARHIDAATPNNIDTTFYQETTSESSEEENVPAKPLRRHVGSFENMTQGDIADYYTHPSGDYASSASLPRTGSPGVWVPPGVDHHLVKQYLAALPEDKRPVNTLGVQWRIKQLQAQLPRYDHNINYCHEMTPEEQEELSMFVESRKENAQGQGEVKSFKKKSKKKCEKCGGVVDCAVLADKVPGRVWHPSCFSCHTCEEILVDLIYFQYDGRLYCGRHHAELLRPRCHACDELIFGHEFITADKHEYHKEHFCCWECDASLGGTKYVSHKGQPYCQGCFEKLFCMRCVTCREPIGVGVTVYRHGTLRWHGNSQCYACSFCKTSLVNRTFMPTEKYVYCSKNCYRCHESLKKTKGK